MAGPSGGVIGIDLGTTFSAAAFLDAAGHAVTIPNRHGEPVTPSVVLIRPDRTILVGADARALAAKTPDRVAMNFKRDMGDKFFHQPIGGKEFSPEALSALVLKRLRRDAVKVIGEVRGVVITVPAYFGDAQRKATQDSGRIAGLRVLDIINEPTAAALANAFRQYLEHEGDPSRLDIAAVATTAPSTTLVFDLGGGTFDVTIIRICGERFDVLATGGEVRLGGIDFDERLVAHLSTEFARRYGVDPRDDPHALRRLINTCELAKIALSARTQTTMIFEHLGKTLHLPVSRRQFEQMASDLLTRTQLSVEMVLEDAMLSWDRIDDVLMVGGSTQMPMVRQMLERISGKRPNLAIAPDQIVAHGAAIHAAIADLDQGGRPPSVTAAPTTDRRQRKAGDALHLSADTPVKSPVTQVARRVRLGDVNSHSLGVIVRSSQENRIVNSVVIPRNTPLPTSRTKVFGTEAPDQRIVRLRIVEGESRDPTGCRQIGECVVHDLPGGLARGAPVEVRFRYQRNGRIHVEATETASGVRAEVTIERVAGFEETELAALVDAVSELSVE